jgi:hypothetical protein
MLGRICVAVACAVFAGCASSTIAYQQPAYPKPPENEIVIAEPFDVVWDRLVKNLSADFFVINNIEKASHLINVSFSSSSPSNFVDCGETNRTFTNASGKQNYTYLTANSSFFTLTNDRGLAFNAKRKTSLDGRANIYVALDSGGTLVRVNTRYALSVDISYYQLSGEPAGNQSTSWAFNTREVFHDSEPNSQIVCVSTGFLEQKIIDAAKLR